MEEVSQLFRQYRDDVYRLAVSYTRSREDAEDVCQTVFLKAMEQNRIQPGKEKHWLLRVTANECRNLLRSHWWKTTVPMEDTISVEPPQINEILQSVMALPPKYRVVLYLRYYEEYTTPEIAALLRISQSTVTTRLSRGREQLKKLLLNPLTESLQFNNKKGCRFKLQPFILLICFDQFLYEHFIQKMSGKRPCQV